MDRRLAIAGRELLKGSFGNAIALATKSSHSELIQASRYRGGNFFFGVNGADTAFIWGNFNSSLIAYQRCPVVSAVVNRKAQCLVNGVRYIMDKDGAEATSPEAIAIRNKLNKPNPLQNGKQFRAQSRVYMGIYGYCPVLVMKPAGFENDISKWTLWNIPPWMLQIMDSPELFFLSTAKPFQSIWLTYLGHSVNVTDKIFFLKENQISTTTYNSAGTTENVSLFLPDSRLMALEENISNLIGSLKGRGSLIRKRGPQWILSNDSNDTGESGLFPVDPKVKDKLQADWLEHGIQSDQKKAIITDAKLKLQTVGFDVQQLKLLEGEVQDSKFICDGLDFPPYLLGLVDSKFDNQQIAERNLYTNATIPDADSEDEQWMELFNTEALGLDIITDYSHLPALQENVAEQGKGRWYMNQGILLEWLQDGITWNRWRELLGEDTVDGMDIYYSEMVKSGRILPQATAQAVSSAANNIVAQTNTDNTGNNNSSNNNNNG